MNCNNLPVIEAATGVPYIGLRRATKVKDAIKADRKFDAFIAACMKSRASLKPSPAIWLGNVN